MRKINILLSTLLLFFCVKQTLAQNAESAARMEASMTESLTNEEIAIAIEKVTHGKRNELVVVPSNPEKVIKIETTSIPSTSTKIVKADRIKKNLKEEQRDTLSKLGILGLILLLVGLVFSITILWPVGVILAIVGLVLLILELV